MSFIFKLMLITFLLNKLGVFYNKVDVLCVILCIILSKFY